MYDPLHSSGPGQGLEHPDSYWSAVTPTTPALPCLETDLDVDVAIIGAGYTGLATAYFLAKEHQLSCVVLEANRIGWGASGRNAGFALQSTGRLSAAAMAKRWGEETARRVLKEFRAGLDVVNEVLQESGNPCDRTEEGFLKVAHSDKLINSMKEANEASVTRFGTQSRFVSKDELWERFVQSEGARAAIHYADGFCLNPLKYAGVLAELCQQREVPIFESTPVTSWSKEGDRHVLSTPRARIKAKRVVAAGNAYTPKNFHSALSNRTLPVLTSVIVTDPIGASTSDNPGLKTNQGIMDTRKLKYYYRKLPDNRILFGGRGAIRGKDANNPLFKNRLLEALHRDFPQYQHVGIAYDWHGWITISLDDVPRVTATKQDPSIFYAAGFSGCGMAYTSQAGRRLAEKLAGCDHGHDLPILSSDLKKFPLPWLKRIGQFGYYQYGRIHDWIR